uniref:BRO-D n=1 Tax=Chrysodeixis chalcites nucleopolyhedrovirus TaxID=320432 RepID=T1QZG7_9ABAC|nr:BRO-D [Chrysodeixis chalcites nucleopolyhedrovirus]AGE61674.1 BRO-D [Chrysodeixis chalcites nucleopolyhedrovirus]
MSLVNKKCEIGGVACDVWIVKVEKDVFMYGGHAIAQFLGYKRPGKALYDHIKPQWRRTWQEIKILNNQDPLETKQAKDKTTSAESQLPANWQPNTVFISEAGVYALIVRCRLPKADLFQKWLFEEVLPQLRKTNSLTSSFESYHNRQLSTYVPVKSFVYMVTNEQYKQKHIYKIGTTTSLDNRLKQLNCGRPFDLLEYDVYEDTGTQGYVIESLLLNEYKSRKLRGEWVQFNSNKEYSDAKLKLKQLVKLYCIESSLCNNQNHNIQNILQLIQDN